MRIIVVVLFKETRLKEMKLVIFFDDSAIDFLVVVCVVVYGCYIVRQDSRAANYDSAL